MTCLVTEQMRSEHKSGQDFRSWTYSLVCLWTSHPNFPIFLYVCWRRAVILPWNLLCCWCCGCCLILHHFSLQAVKPSLPADFLDRGHNQLYLLMFCPNAWSRICSEVLTIDTMFSTLKLSATIHVVYIWG